MNGQELYERYVALYVLYNIEVQPWEDLDDVDREIWNRLAQDLENL